jgi:hypothetical protein
MSAALWTVEQTAGTNFRFTNATGGRAAMIVMQGLGFDFDSEVPHPLAEGESFDVDLPRPGIGIRVVWTTPDDMQNHSFDYRRSNPFGAESG